MSLPSLPPLGPPNLFNGDSGPGGQNDFAQWWVMRPYLRNILIADYNVRFYGAVGDGVHDDSAAVQAAELDAALNGGVVYLPGGPYLFNNTVIYDNYVHFRGDGPRVTKIIAGPGMANKPLFQSRNFASLTGTNSGGISGAGEFSFSKMTLDGSNGTLAGTLGIQNYGYGFWLRYCVLQNCGGDGLYSEWATASDTSPFNDDLIARVHNVKVINNRGHGIEWAGPHDSGFDGVVVYNSGNQDNHAGIYVKNSALWNGGGLSIVNSHSSGNNQTWGLKTEGSVFLTNNQWEGAQGAMVLFTGSDGTHTSQNSIMSGDTLYAAGAIAAPVGLEIGAAGVPINMLHLRGMVSNCTSGALKLTNDGGYNQIHLANFQASGTIISGVPNIHTVISIEAFGSGVSQTGLADHVLATGTASTLGALQANVATQNISGNATRGTVTITTGASGPAVGANVVVINFANAFPGTPIIILSANVGQFGWSAPSANGFTIINNGPAALTGGGATYFISYVVIG